MDTHFLVTPHLIIDTEWNVCWTCFIYFFAVLHWTFLYCMLFKFMINISFQLATGSHNMAIYLRTLHVFDFFWFVMEKIQRATHRFLINLLVCIVFFLLFSSAIPLQQRCRNLLPNFYFFFFVNQTSTLTFYLLFLFWITLDFLCVSKEYSCYVHFCILFLIFVTLVFWGSLSISFFFRN